MQCEISYIYKGIHLLLIMQNTESQVSYKLTELTRTYAVSFIYDT